MADQVQATPAERLIDFDMRVVVFGSRGYDDYEFFSNAMKLYVERWPGKKMVFLSGMAATGADALIVRWCKEHGYAWCEMPADWDNIAAPGAKVKYNRSGNAYNVLAGFQRNRSMAALSSHYVSFYDGSSPGTKDMLEICKSLALAPMIFLIDVERKGTYHGR